METAAAMAAFRPPTIHSRRKPTSFPPKPATPTPFPLPHHHRTITASSATVPTSPPASSDAGLVLSSAPLGSWDAHAVGSPVVKRYLGDDEDRWLMWHHGSASSAAADSIGLAVSSNGFHWDRSPEPVLQKSPDWWAFDTHSLRPSEIVIMSSDKLRAPSAVYWMYYTGFTQETIKIKNPDGELLYKSLPGLAISQDGRHWARIEGDHHTGALFDVGDWDSGFVAAPKVVYHEFGDLRMYYHSLDSDSGCCSIGIARSRDGIKWVKLGKVMGAGPDGSFDEGGAKNAHVVRREKGGYVMAYEGVGGASIGLAVSEDGLKEWRRCGESAVLRPSDGFGWDNRGVGAPCLVEMDGGDEWRLYYSGFGDGGSSGIGLAVCRDPGLVGFERWKGATKHPDR